MTIFRVSIKLDGKTAIEKFFEDCDMALDYFDKLCVAHKEPKVTEEEYFNCEGFLVRYISFLTTLEFDTASVITKPTDIDDTELLEF